MSELTDRASKSPEILRMERERLFRAFDIYKANVRYGVIGESDEEHTLITEWYRKALDLDTNAIRDYPIVLNRYLK